MTKRSCGEIAGYRACYARERIRTSPTPLSPLRGEIVFVVVWLASLLSNLVLVPFRARPAPSLEPTYQPTEQELGVPGPLRSRLSGRLLHGRYRAAPSMSRLMRDLRRSAAHDAARAALMARIGGDAVALEWAAGLVDLGLEWRLALHVRPGVPDADVVSAWRAEARADKAAAEAALKAKISDANEAEDVEDDEVGPRSPGR